MIDAAAFHDTNASCYEYASSISEGVWVTLDENATSTPFNQAAIEYAINNTKGFVIGSGNSIPDYVPVDKYLLMLEVIREEINNP